MVLKAGTSQTKKMFLQKKIQNQFIISADKIDKKN